MKYLSNRGLFNTSSKPHKYEVYCGFCRGRNSEYVTGGMRIKNDKEIVVRLNHRGEEASLPIRYCPQCWRKMI